MEAHWLSHRLIRYYKCNQCCDWCLATCSQNLSELSWGDLTLRSLWRATMTMHDNNDPSPWTAVAGFEKKYGLLDVLHLVHLGTLRDLCAGAIIDTLEEGSLQKYYGLQGRPFDEVLFAFSHHANAWAKDNDFELGIGTLDMGRLGRPNHLHWPMPQLDSQIKAGRVRTLLAFITFVMVQLIDSNLVPQNKIMYGKVRACCCWTLDTALSIWNQCKSVAMSPGDVTTASWLCRVHSASYQYLAVQSLRERRLLWKVRPKSHYFVHFVDFYETTGLSPIHMSAFLDEDFMGKARKICLSCHGATFMKQWARRYVLKRALQWRKK